MKTLVDKLQIIGLKENGFSNREIAKMVKCNRKTVAKYWNSYLKQKALLQLPDQDTKVLQEQITEPPKYNVENRKRIKFTAEIKAALNNILESESRKDKILGTHKQGMTKVQIHQALVQMGFDISLSSISSEINRIRNATKECFIRQEYGYGDRLEYDFGEVKLVIGGVTKTYHMAVLSSPGGNFRWAYL